MKASEAERRGKLERLREGGVDPYPRSFLDRVKVREILDTAEPAATEADDRPESDYRVAGRLTARRSHRNVVFWDLQDFSGSIEVYARLADLGEDSFRQMKELNVGDFVGIDGARVLTDRGEVAIRATDFVLLAKALRDPPDFVHGIGDPETRYRNRELDMMVSKRSRDVFLLRSKMLIAIRALMSERGFVELETPILQPLFGGATARPFETHHHALDRRLYLRTATELYLKRAVIGGFENVFELGRIFRNEGISTEHNPEFTMLEMMVNGADFLTVMEFAENLVSDLVQAVCGTRQVEYKGTVIDFTAPWPRIRLREALLEATGLDITTCSCEELAECLGVSDGNASLDWTTLVEKAQKRFVEAKLVQPTFIIELPIRAWPVNRGTTEHPELLGEVFDVVAGGMEILAGGTEINDPAEQRRRFAEQKEIDDPEDDDLEPHPYDGAFVQALEYGMPPIGGCGLGVDRLMMILTNSRSLRDVVLFPMMRTA